MEIFFKSLPLIAILALSYLLFISPDTLLGEGMKLTLSALLGAISSFVFLQLSRFVEGIEEKKANHRSALASLEFKLNMQLNWVSDVITHLKNRESIVERVISNESEFANDGSSYRDPENMKSDIFNVLNLSFVNDMLKLVTSYDKIQNDLRTMENSYTFILNLAISDKSYLSSYKRGLPYHLKGAQSIRKFSELTLVLTKDSLSKCRVLSRESKSLLGKFRRYLVLQPDPGRFQEKVEAELKTLNSEMQETWSKSNEELEEIGVI